MSRARSSSPLAPGAITGVLASSGLGGRIRADVRTEASVPINNSSGDATYSLGCFLWRVDAGTAALICPLSKVGGRCERTRTRRRRRKGRLFLLLHNLLLISDIIPPVFQMIIWKSGVAALIQQHYTSPRDY